jgi:hypothetical protein
MPDGYGQLFSKLPLADIFLFTDSSGLPGSLLESFAVQVPDIFPPMTNSITKVKSKLHPILSGGSSYWFAVGPDPNSVSDFWLLDNTGAAGVSVFRTSPTSPW